LETVATGEEGFQAFRLSGFHPNEVDARSDRRVLVVFKPTSVD
jgi:hypothetical protein